MNKDYSKNDRAKDVMGLRPTDGQPIDFPCELDYQCPMCRKEMDEGLEWSEYYGFLWCRKCNKDYPSPFCKKDIDKGIKVFLDIIDNYKKHNKQFNK